MMALTQGARQCATSPPRPTELITGYVGISLPVPLQATRRCRPTRWTGRYWALVEGSVRRACSACPAVSGGTRQTARSAVISPALTSSIWRRRPGKEQRTRSAPRRNDRYRPGADIDGTEIPQCGGLLPHRMPTCAGSAQRAASRFRTIQVVSKDLAAPLRQVEAEVD